MHLGLLSPDFLNHKMNCLQDKHEIQTKSQAYPQNVQDRGLTVCLGWALLSQVLCRVPFRHIIISHSNDLRVEVDMISTGQRLRESNYLPKVTQAESVCCVCLLCFNH